MLLLLGILSQMLLAFAFCIPAFFCFMAFDSPRSDAPLSRYIAFTGIFSLPTILLLGALNSSVLWIYYGADIAWMSLFHSFRLAVLDVILVGTSVFFAKKRAFF